MFNMKRRKSVIALSLLLGLAACDAPPGGINGEPPYVPSNTGSGGAPGHLIAEWEAKEAAEAARQAQTAEAPELVPNARDELANKPGTQDRLTPISEKLPDITRRPLEPERKSVSTPETSYQAPAWFTDRGSLAQLGAVNAEVSPPLKLRWHVDLPGAIHAPATGAHGKLYVGAGNTLYALSPQNGATQWSYSVQGTDSAQAISNPVAAVSENKDLVQKVFLVDGAGHLHAINGQNGEAFWSFVNPSPNSFNSAPCQCCRASLFYAWARPWLPIAGPLHRGS